MKDQEIVEAIIELRNRVSTLEDRLEPVPDDTEPTTPEGTEPTTPEGTEPTTQKPTEATN